MNTIGFHQNFHPLSALLKDLNQDQVLTCTSKLGTLMYYQSH